MAKVHPLFTPETSDDSTTSTTTTSCSNNKYMTSKRATFTVWMKSLVMQGNGCTAFDENGDIVYRIDNYDDKRSCEVYLMDLRGKLLFTILEDRTFGFPSWKGYKSGDSDDTKALFQVRKTWGSILGDKHKECLYKVTLTSEADWYMLEVVGGKSAALRIRVGNGGVVAEAKRKESSSGVVLGNDVLRLVVEPHVDHSFIMALVTVYGLIGHQI